MKLVVLLTLVGISLAACNKGTGGNSQLVAPDTSSAAIVANDQGIGGNANNMQVPAKSAN